MDTLRDELDQAIPRFDPGTGPIEPDLERLVGAGRRAVRRRRARVCSAAVGGLLVSGLAVAGTGILPSLGPHVEKDPLVVTDTASATSGTPPADTSQEIELSLASLLEVSRACGRYSRLEAGSGTLTAAGEEVEPTEQVTGSGWSATEFRCGSDVIRLLHGGGQGIVGRYPAAEGSTLREWAEANVGQLPL